MLADTDAAAKVDLMKAKTYNYGSAHWPIVRWIFLPLHLAKAACFCLYSFKNHQDRLSQRGKKGFRSCLILE